MITKWVRCAVNDQGGFDRGQQGWAELRELPGFLGQYGGWSRRENGSEIGHVVAFWSDPDSYEQFMAGPHDVLAQGQVGTFSSIDVRLFEGQNIGSGFDAASAAAAFRLAHCLVKADRVDHFTHVQDTVWNPGMSEAPGFRGGVFAQRGTQEFLVLTAWATKAAHAHYQSEWFPALRDRAVPSADLDTITGYVVDLEPSWSVTAPR